MSPRRRQGAVLIAGAAVLYLLVEVGGLRFHFTPLLVGLAFLAAAFSAGARGSYWAPGLVVTAWGLGMVLITEGLVESVTREAGFLAAAGAGALAAAALGRWGGFSVDALGTAAAVFGAGLVHSLEPRVEALGYATTYAAALAVLGLLRLAAPEGAASRRA